MIVTKKGSRLARGRADPGLVMVILFTLLGWGAATAVFMLAERVYQSEAKLLIRYVVERSPADSVDLILDGSNGWGPIVAAEKEILTSADVAREAAERVGPEKLAPDSDAEAGPLLGAPALVQAGLQVSAVDGSNVIRARFTHPDAQLSPTVLDTVLQTYFEKHLEIHRSVSSFDHTMQQADRARSEYLMIEENLSRLRAEPEEHELRIRSLERDLRLAEDRDEKMAASLEKLRRDVTLDPSQLQNLSVIQTPSHPKRVRDQRSLEAARALAIGGPLLGGLLALLYWVARIAGSLGQGRGKPQVTADDH